MTEIRLTLARHGPVRCLTGGAEGASAAPVVLLVHGSGGDARVWEPLLPLLRSVRGVAPDLPGRGGSTGPRLPSAGAYAAFIDELRQALEVERVVVAGQSLGGAIAQHYAVDFEPHCRGIVAANTACDFHIAPERLRAIDEDWGGCVAHYARGQVSPRASAELQAAARAMVALREREAFKDDLRVCHAFDAKPWLHRLRVPLLVLVGHEDPLVVPARSFALYERVPHAEMVVLAPCGHCPMLEQPARMAAELERFAGSLV